MDFLLPQKQARMKLLHMDIKSLIMRRENISGTGSTK